MRRESAPRPAQDYGENGYISEFINTACDMVEIENLEDDVPKSFIVRGLIKGGKMGFLDKPVSDPARGWYNCTNAGTPTRYGYRDEYYFTMADGLGGFYASEKDGAKEVRANATGFPIIQTYRKYAATLALCDRAICANLRASIASRMLTAADQKQREAIEIALDDIEDGRPVIVEDKIRQAFEAADISTDFIADNINTVRSAVWADAATRLGSVSGTQYKKERVQTAEVDASIAETIDAVYIMINSFNEDVRRQNIRNRDGKLYRMIYTGYAARFDTDGEPTKTPVEGRR